MFKELKEKMQSHVENMTKDVDFLFVTDTENEELINLYLDSFPEGTNNIFRERRYHDCSCCKNFIKTFGNVVSIKDDKINTIWDFDSKSETYQPVINALSKYVKSKEIKNVFSAKEKKIGTDYNFEKSGDDVIRWDHFYVDLPIKFLNVDVNEIKTNKEVLERTLNEISIESIEVVLELIEQKSLYKGDEWRNSLKKLISLYNKETDKIFYWKNAIILGASICRIKNHSIGVLLKDITEGMDLNKAVERYEKIVAPSNYKRPKEIFSEKMVDQAEKTIKELGFLDSLGRRFAKLSDININNILFANRNVKEILESSLFDELKKDVVSKKRNFDKVEKVNIDHFIEKILPDVNNIEVYVENKHSDNFVSLIAPTNNNSKTMFKWDNNFSWVYSGNATDSMKDLVKKHGGKVDGVLRFSIKWNESGNNNIDFDAHCIEPNRNKIYFRNKKIIHKSSGMLDVDIITPKGKVAVENITWTDINKMKEGTYSFIVNNYSGRQSNEGFSAEIEYNGEIFSFEYNKILKSKEDVLVAKILFDKKNGIRFIESLESDQSNKEIWGINTNNFVPVSVFMTSPNFWDNKIGNKHYFFMLKDCKNPDTPNGFFNEFLKEDLLKHKRVFAALGSKMRVKHSDNQLSGIGFCSTKRNEVTVKVEGKFKRIIKLTF